MNVCHHDDVCRDEAPFTFDSKLDSRERRDHPTLQLIVPRTWLVLARDELSVWDH